MHLVHQLAFWVKRGGADAGAERRGGGRIPYRDKMQQDRRVYRLTRHGVFVGEYKTPEDLAKHLDVAELVEDDADS